MSEVSLHLNLGRAYRESRNYNSAIEELKQALELSPDNAELYIELGRIFREMRNFNLAVKELRKAISLSLDNEEAHLELGRIHNEQKQYPQALEELDTALGLNPANARIHIELGQIHRLLKDYTEAVKHFKQAIELGLDNEEAHLELGRIRSEQGKYALAEREFQDGLRLNPKNGQSNAELAWLYEKKKNYELAMKELKVALRKGIDEDFIYRGLSRISHKQKIIEEFEKFIQSNDNIEKSASGIITEYIFQEGYSSFRKKIKEITKTNPECLHAHIELAWIYIWHKQYDLAIEELKNINEITSSDKRFNVNPVLDYLYKGDYKSALKEFEQTTTICTDSSNDNGNLHKEIILTLKDLFPDKIAIIDGLIQNLENIHSLHNWRYPAITKTEGLILYLITRLLKPAIIIEAGMWMGTSTAYLARGCCDNKMGKVISVDKQEEVGYAIPDDLLPYVEFYKNVDIKDELPKICNKENKIDIFFHDSLNSYELLNWEISEILPFISKDGLIIAHDIYNITDSPTMDVPYFFSKIKDKTRCYLFNTGNGIGVIKDFGELEVKK